MPIQSKSIWQQISNPRETYTDGYGSHREVYEPDYITVGRKIYDEVDKFLNGPDNINGIPIKQGAGALEFFFDPSSVGKLDDVAKLAKHLDKFKMDELRRFKLRRKINKKNKPINVCFSLHISAYLHILGQLWLLTQSWPCCFNSLFWWSWCTPWTLSR